MSPHTPHAAYVNLLESEALLSCFHQAPPVDFSAHRSEEGLYYFLADFDLLTTAEEELRQRLRSTPLYRYWGRVLRWKSCFIGTTVSEYTPFPRSMTPTAVAEWVKTHCGPQARLSIIKDIPDASPLLSDEDNHYSATLLATCEQAGFINVEGQALAYVAMDFADLDEYMQRFSHSRRRDLRRKLKKRQALQVEVLPTGDPRFSDLQWLAQLYCYYLAVYDQSEIHFDLLTPEFFTRLFQDGRSGGQVFLYWHQQELVGFNLCYVQNGYLIDKYIGLDYQQAREFSLYFVSWFENLQYALTHGLRYYIAGWTDPQVKAELGASFTFTRHLVWVRNPLLRRILNRYSHHFESDRLWREEQLP